MARLTFKVSDNEELSFPLSRRSKTSLGRDAENDIVIDNNYISSHHAEFRYKEEQGGFLAVDLNSYNGIKVNGAKIERKVLKDGDSLHFGQLEARFYTDDAATAKSSAAEEPPKPNSASAPASGAVVVPKAATPPGVKTAKLTPDVPAPAVAKVQAPAAAPAPTPVIPTQKMEPPTPEENSPDKPTSVAARRPVVTPSPVV
ncbi:MAG: FHA domain-containing protein, partial [Verrucomicrobiota bacterium]